jgi:hypothetical protein
MNGSSCSEGIESRKNSPGITVVSSHLKGVPGVVGVESIVPLRAFFSTR